jgi:hypothetical protein
MLPIEKIAGDKGTPYIAAATGEVTVNCVGFQSWDDTTVLSSVKTVVGATTTERVATRLNLAAQTIPLGMVVMFGFVAQKITLSAGGGVYLRATDF